ncbi:chitobiase/beta-hexosaminidase C-terminal domain-containing protein [bacterium]|nr:chitobiase/beta-hexosaminidase C-terminal domain-containing protein [bacterium]
MNRVKKLFFLLYIALFLGAASANYIDVTFEANTSNWDRNSIVTVSVVLTNTSTNAIDIQGLELDFDYDAISFKALPTMYSDGFTGSLVINEIDLSTAGKAHYLKAKTYGNSQQIAGSGTFTAYTLQFIVTSDNAQEGITSFDFDAYYTNDISNTDAESVAKSFTSSNYTIVGDTTAPIAYASPTSQTMNISTQTDIVLQINTSQYTDNDLQYIKYTLDGNDPDGNSTTYIGSITITPNIGEVTLKFVGVDNDNNTQNVQTETYTVDTIRPTMDTLVITPNLAKVATVVTVSFTVGEQLLSQPTVLIAGQSTIGVDTSYPTYVYTRTLDGGESEGTQNASITIQDLAGNPTTNTSLEFNVDFSVPTYVPVLISPDPVVSGNQVIITFNASERLNYSNTTLNIMGRASEFVSEIFTGGKWTYTYQTIEPLTGTENTAIIVVHGEDIIGNRSDSNEGWGNITVSGYDLLNNYGVDISSSINFNYYEE